MKFDDIMKKTWRCTKKVETGYLGVLHVYSEKEGRMTKGQEVESNLLFDLMIPLCDKNLFLSSE
jgi:hypothetical protein